MSRSRKSNTLYSHPFSKAYWRDAAAELKDTHMLVFAALMIALRLVMKQVAIPITPFLKINTAFFVNALGAMVFGPVMAMLAACITDVLGYVIRPEGMYFLPFILTEVGGALVFALFHPALAEGNNGSLDFEQRINGKAVLKTIEPIRERLQDLSAVFFSGHDVVIYGIVLSPDGYIATKASELHSYRDLTIRVGSSKYGQFREIGSDPSTDIAVVKVEAAGLHAPGPVSNDAAMGTLVVINGSTTRTSSRPRLGSLSAEQRPIPNGDTAYLGVVFGTPCTIQEVTKDGPAAQAGAKAGDEILAVDGTPVTALDAVSPILSRKKVGERVTLKVKRKDKRLSYTITLGSRRQALGGNAPEDSNDLISGGFSKRRDDFPMVLQHDTPSRYTLMGGPLLNLKGELIGMNIARVNRAENYALPISVVQKSVQNILKNTPQPGK